MTEGPRLVFRTDPNITTYNVQYNIWESLFREDEIETTNFNSKTYLDKEVIVYYWRFPFKKEKITVLMH